MVLVKDVSDSMLADMWEGRSKNFSRDNKMRWMVAAGLLRPVVFDQQMDRWDVACPNDAFDIEVLFV